MRKKEFIWLSITRSVYSGHQLACGEPVIARFRAPPVGLEEGGGGEEGNDSGGVALVRKKVKGYVV